MTSWSSFSCRAPTGLVRRAAPAALVGLLAAPLMLISAAPAHGAVTGSVVSGLIDPTIPPPPPTIPEEPPVIPELPPPTIPAPS